LFDLDPYDADIDQQSLCSAEDHRIEALCDEERYLELHTDIMEKAAYEGTLLAIIKHIWSTSFDMFDIHPLGP
jgi:hypothetical protein